jgi:hypothetical protein
LLCENTLAARFFLSQPDLDLEAVTVPGSLTAVMAAVLTGNRDALQSLLQRKPNLELKNDEVSLIKRGLLFLILVRRCVVVSLVLYFFRFFFLSSILFSWSHLLGRHCLYIGCA